MQCLKLLGFPVHSCIAPVLPNFAVRLNNFQLRILKISEITDIWHWFLPSDTRYNCYEWCRWAIRSIIKSMLYFNLSTNKEFYLISRLIEPGFQTVQIDWYIWKATLFCKLLALYNIFFSFSSNVHIILLLDRMYSNPTSGYLVLLEHFVQNHLGALLGYKRVDQQAEDVEYL